MGRPTPSGQAACSSCLPRQPARPLQLSRLASLPSCPPEFRRLPAVADNSVPAEWRYRVHAARRRVMLMIRVMLLLKRGKKLAHRIPQLEDLSFTVPQVCVCVCVCVCVSSVSGGETLGLKP